MAKAKVGIELIVFQGREQKDMDGVLKECAEAGYSCVETGYIVSYPLLKLCIDKRWY